jgi:hypothetical protein
MSPIDKIMQANAHELAIVLISPSIVKSGDFVYILDDIYRQKFTIAGVRKARLDYEDLTVLFKDLAPRMYNIETLWDNEFAPKDAGDSIILVLEKEKAVTDVTAIIGRSQVKEKADFLKYKKKQTTTSYSFNQTASTIIQEYGAFIYSFPGVPQNQQKITYFFENLPNSKHFDISLC